MDKTKLSIYILRTKFIAPYARIFRFPIDIRGKQWIDFGKRLTTGKYCRIEAFGNKQTTTKLIRFGKNVQMNDSTHISAIESVIIGDNVLMAGHVYISDNAHGFYKQGEKEQSSPNEPPAKRSYFTAPVCIEENVWLAENVVVMPGVRIGKGSIIGANSTVTKDVPPAVIAVGSPARVVKRYDFDSRKWIRIEE